MKNSELSVYQTRNDPNIYLPQPLYYLNEYSILQASSHDNEDSFALSDASNGEKDATDADIDNLGNTDDAEQLNV